MGFKLPGKSIQSGTSGHRSALKQVDKKRATSWFAGEEGWLPDEVQGGDKGYIDQSGKKKLYEPKENTENTETTENTEKKKNSNIGKKGLYGSDMSWAEGQAKSEEMGGDLNSWTKERKKHKKGTNEYNKLQNKINESLGNKKRYPVTEDKPVESEKVQKLEEEHVESDAAIVEDAEDKPTMNVVKNEEGEEVYGAALDADKDLNKNELKYTRKKEKQRVKDARKKHGRGSDEVKSAKATKKEEVKKTVSLSIEMKS